MPLVPQSRKGRLLVLVVVLLLLVGGGTTLALRGGGGATKTDLLAGPVTVVGCAKAETVEVAARTLARSTRKPPGPVLTAHPSATPRPTRSATPSPTPSPSAVATRTLLPTPTPTSGPTATRTRPPDPTPSSTFSGKPIYGQAVVVTPLAVRATVSKGRFHLSGLAAGTVYQLGARVPSCPGAKVVVPNGGFFVAGRTQAPAIAVVAPPQLTRTPKGYTWAGGPGTHGASFTLSVGAGPTTCSAPRGVLAEGTLDGAGGPLSVDPAKVRKAIAKAGTPFTGSLHLRVVRKGGPCVPSADLPVPVFEVGLPQDGETQLEVYDHPKLATELGGHCDVCSGWPYDPQYWKTSSAFDWAEPSQSTRPFHWASSAPATTDGEWQLSTAPLPSTCHPAGLLMHGSTGYAPGPLLSDSTGAPPLFTIDFGAMALDKATTYYLRVVPVNEQGACTGPASPTVSLSYKEKPADLSGCPPTCLPVPAKPPAQASLSALITTYQPLTGPSANPPYCFQALVDHTVSSNILDFASDVVGFMTVGSGNAVHAGQQVCFTPSSNDDSSFWDDLTSVADFVLDVVSFPAKVYDLYEQIIPNILAEIIPGCDDTCRGYLLTAEKAGLAAVGLPPSLPDASRLVNDSEGYLVGQAAEATGIPEPVVKAAYEQGKQKMIGALAATSSNQTGLSCDWCAFDNGVRAPGATLLITRPASDDPSLPLPERVCLGNSASAVDGSNPAYVASPLYYGSCAPMPKSFPPGSSLVLPMSLTCNVDQLKQYEVNEFSKSKSQLGGSDAQLDRLAFQDWLGQQNHTPSVTLRVVTESHYDAGPSFPSQLLQSVLSTRSFTIG